MAKFIPAGFDAARVIGGLHTAMGFGEPTRAADKATFYILSQAATADPVDGEGLPFDPTKSRPTTRTPKTVPCAVEVFEGSTTRDSFGDAQASRVVLTLLDPDYQQVKGFSYVVAGGDKYYYTKTDPPVALGSIDVWTVHCTAQDER